MNHTMAKRLDVFAESLGRVERKLDACLTATGPHEAPEIPPLPDPVRLPQITVVDLTGMAKALHAYGHVIEPGDTQEEAIRRVLDIERARRDAAINEERETRALSRDLTDKLDRALDELAEAKVGAATLCREWPGGPARILPGGVVVLPGSLSTLFRERRRWWGRLRR